MKPFLFILNFAIGLFNLWAVGNDVNHHIPVLAVINGVCAVISFSVAYWVLWQ